MWLANAVMRSPAHCAAAPCNEGHDCTAGTCIGFPNIDANSCNVIMLLSESRIRTSDELRSAAATAAFAIFLMADVLFAPRTRLLSFCDLPARENKPSNRFSAARTKLQERSAKRRPSRSMWCSGGPLAIRGFSYGWSLMQMSLSRPFCGASKTGQECGCMFPGCTIMLLGL
jgi:hypothetical protein